MNELPLASTPSAEVPTIDADPFGDGGSVDPYPFQVAVRETADVVRLGRYGCYATGRHEHVAAVLRNWQDYGSAAGVGLSNFAVSTPWRQRSIILEADPPHHDAPHRVLAEVLGPRTQRTLRDQWYAGADALVGRLLARTTTFDALTELATAFPLRVFPDAVGIAPGGRHQLLGFSDVLFNAFGPRNALVRDAAADARALAAWVDASCRREELSPDGLGARIWAAADRGEITADQAPDVVRSLFAAGVNTAVHALGSMVHALANHPEQWALVREDEALRRRALDEALRWSTPVQTFFRTTLRDVSLAGARIGTHEKVMVLLGAANRDPRRWEDPDRFDVTRDTAGHVGFGTGLHACLGQSFARLEAEALLAAMVARIETIEPAGPAVPRPNNTLRAWARIPVRVTVRA
ncbi:cytochrome P450 [Isoptericola sp. b515]|uniref:cytochrome P450 n=1 Tax=Isoptericola sp. b515 TaxID=3064652 RepID=UPI002713FF97|nr:cytochrome P450 [Isoptericola sp. b515]MDO8147731.1 cytochrome P450 [Isoptericola sp. b515]